MRIDRLAIALSLLAACGTATEPPSPSAPAVVAPPPAPTTPPPPPGAHPVWPIVAIEAVLAQLPSATAIRITQGWMGLSPVAPIAHHYEIVVAGEVATVHAVCHASSHEHALPDSRIPASDLAPILAHLGVLPLSANGYEPRIDHTDDYPELTIEIDTPSGTITFYSRSQGAMHEPWQATVGTDVAVIDSVVPGEALRDIGLLLHAERCTEWTQTLH